ncbi:MAG: hypothetical protein HFH63_05950 [Lachnospiraceae bacterium]|nr:hypothetical protein [Lachnospiraceae bacterium]
MNYVNGIFVVIYSLLVLINGERVIEIWCYIISNKKQVLMQKEMTNIFVCMLSLVTSLFCFVFGVFHNLTFLDQETRFITIKDSVIFYIICGILDFIRQYKMKLESDILNKSVTKEVIFIIGSLVSLFIGFILK